MSANTPMIIRANSILGMVSNNSFMVPSADFPCGTHQWMILWKVHILNYSCAKFTMGLHNLEFFICKSAWFIQYFFRNMNFTDVMKRRCRCDNRNICLCQRIRICCFYQFFQHHFRCCSDMQDMFFAFLVARSQYITQNPDHDIIIFFFFVNLINDHIDQALLICIQPQSILNSPAPSSFADSISEAGIRRMDLVSRNTENGANAPGRMIAQRVLSSPRKSETR